MSLPLLCSLAGVLDCFGKEQVNKVVNRGAWRDICGLLPSLICPEHFRQMCSLAELALEQEVFR